MSRESDQNRLREYGIEQKPALERVEGGHDFLHVPAHVAKKEGIWASNDVEADKRRAGLPRRIVMSQSRSVSLSGDNSPPYATTRKSIDISEYSDERESQISILKIYDEWNKFLMKRRNLRRIYISMLLENKSNYETWSKVEREWEKDTDNGILYGDGLSEVKVDYREEHADPRALTMNQNEKRINLWRHISLSEFLASNMYDGKNTIYCRSESYTNKLFSYIAAISLDEQTFQCEYVIRQILEMALCRTVVVDERVARTVANRTKGGDLIDDKLAVILAWMGIWVVGKVEFRRNGKPIYNDKEQGSYIVGDSPTSNNGLVKMILNFREQDGKFDFEIKYPSDTSRLLPSPPEAAEVLSVHQSLLDTKFQEPLKNLFDDTTGEAIRWREQWVMAMRPNILSTLVHSGRGHPGDVLPKNSAFLEYSMLQINLLNNPSKFLFIQQALSSTK